MMLTKMEHVIRLYCNAVEIKPVVSEHGYLVAVVVAPIHTNKSGKVQKGSWSVLGNGPKP
jgi:hypothetical protein